MENNEILNLDTRRMIYNYVSEYPGLHIRELSRKTKIPRSTLNYHLRYLKKYGLIVINSEEGYERVYVKKDIGNMDKKLIHAMRQETPCKIVLYVALVLSASQKELSEELELSSTTVGKHIKRLVKMEIIEPAPFENGTICTSHVDKTIIECTPKGREVFYRIAMKKIQIYILVLFCTNY